eukprot:3662815-Pyramimonas_sp.AAC.1
MNTVPEGDVLKRLRTACSLRLKAVEFWAYEDNVDFKTENGLEGEAYNEQARQAMDALVQSLVSKDMANLQAKSVLEARAASFADG